MFIFTRGDKVPIPSMRARHELEKQYPDNVSVYQNKSALKPQEFLFLDKNSQDTPNFFRRHDDYRGQGTQFFNSYDPTNTLSYELNFIIQEYIQSKHDDEYALQNFLLFTKDLLRKYCYEEDKTLRDIVNIARLMIAIKAGHCPTLDINLLNSVLDFKDVCNITRFAILNGSHLSDQHTNICKNLTIMTFAHYGFGDYYAAARLIALLQAQNPTVMIHWMICGDRANLPQEMTDSNTLRIHWIEDLYQIAQEDLQSLQTELFVIFPQVPDRYASLMVDILKKRIGNQPLVYCLEYSHIFRLNFPGVTPVQTGLGADEAGIFIVPPPPQNALTFIDTQDPILSVLYTNISSTQFTTVSPEDYEATSVLFFGYASSSSKTVENVGVSIENFIDIALHIAQTEQLQKNVDIIVPLHSSILCNNMNFSNYRKVQLVTQNKDKSVNYRTLVDNSSHATKPTLRLINLFPFCHATFQNLVFASHPFKMCTGDQSFSEVISCSRTIPFYQAMAWKKNLYINYIEIAERALGEANLDPNESLAIKWLILMQTLDHKTLEMAKVMATNPNLLDEFKLIHDYIIARKNLSLVLPRFLNYLANEHEIVNNQNASNQAIVPMQSSNMRFFGRMNNLEGSATQCEPMSSTISLSAGRTDE
jgi:hypothetical protein